MAFKCGKGGCRWAGKEFSEDEAKDLNGICPICKAPLVSVGPKPEDRETGIIASYPILIAQPLAGLLKKRDAEAKVKGLVDVFTNVLKYLALIVETEYLDSPHRDESLNSILKEDLERPLVSAWNKFLRAALPSLEKAGHAWFIPELKPFYDRIEGAIKEKDKVLIPGKGYYDEEGEFVETRSRLGLLSALISYRNKFAHGFSQSEEEALAEFGFYRDVLGKVLEEMAWCVNYPLFKREDGAVFRLMGEDPVKTDPPFQPGSWQTNLVLASPSGDRVLSLVPFMIVPREHISESSKNEDILVYDQSTGKRILYVSPRGHQRELLSVIGRWRELIEKKQIVMPLLDRGSLAPELLRQRSERATRETQKALRESLKVLQGLYCSRPDLEPHLRAWPGGSFPLMAVSARAGAGKTCLLDHMAEEWREAGIPVLFLRGKELPEADIMSALRTILRLAPDVAPSDLGQALSGEDKPLLVVIDGLDEHPQRQNLLHSVIRFCWETGVPRQLKCLISYRSEDTSWIKISRDVKELFNPCKIGQEEQGNIAAEETGEPPVLAIPPLTYPEQKAMWNAYSSREGGCFSPQFSFGQLELKSRAMIQFLRNPLILRLFLELYSSKPLPSSISRHHLFDLYFQMLRDLTKENGDFLMNIARICLEQKKTAVDIDSLFIDPRTAEIIRRTDIDSPYRKLLKRGVLAECSQASATSVSFVIEAFFENILGRVLAADSLADSPEDLIASFLARSSYPSMKGAFEAALAAKIALLGRGFLYETIRLSGEATIGKAGIALGQLLLETRSPARLAEEIAKSASDNELKAAIEAAKMCTGELEFEIGSVFLKAIISTNKFDFKSDIGADILTFLGDIEFVLGNYKKSIEYNEKSLAIRSSILGLKHPKIPSNHFKIANAFSRLGNSEKYWSHWSMGNNIECEQLGFADPQWRGLITLKNMAPTKSLLDIQDNADSLDGTAHTWSYLGDHCKALELYEKALLLRVDEYGENHPVVAISYNNIGNVFINLSEHRKSLEFHQQALLIRLAIFGENHPDVAHSYANIGVSYHYLGEHKKSLESHEEALSIRMAIYGENHPDVAVSLTNIGISYFNLGEFLNSLESHQKALSIRLAVLGENHPEVAQSYENIGVSYDNLGEHEKSLDSHKKSLSIRLANYGENHPEVALSYTNKGISYFNLGELHKSLESHQKSLLIFLSLLGEYHPDIARSYRNIGSVYEALGDDDKAREFLEKAEAIEQNSKKNEGK